MARGYGHKVALPSGSLPLVYDLLRGGRAVTAHYNRYLGQQPAVYDMHYALEFGVLLSGRMSRHYPEWSTRLQPGEVWFQGAWEPHGYEVPSSPTTALVFGVIPQTFMAGLMGTADYDWMAPFLAPPAARPQTPPALRREAWTAAQKAVSRLTGDTPPAGVWSTLMLFELMLLARDGWAAPARPSAPSPESYQLVNRAIAHVLASRRQITVEEAAHACGLGRNAFSRLFTSSVGLSFAKYGLRHRLSGGAEQLRRTDHPIKAIAAEWHFTDASHFTQCFRKHYGCSPAEYRRRF
jgi:AraC-like DNA-binding protein